MSTLSEGSSIPDIPVDSAGSSVSSSLHVEYEELLRYAVVTPKITVPRVVEKAKMPEFSSVSSERTAESYERETSNAQREVTRLPTTPVFVGKSVNHDEESESLEQSTEERSPAITNNVDQNSTFTSSQSTTPDHSEMDLQQSPSVDGDLVRMESQLDIWCLDMKRNILAEFAQSKMALLERHRHALRNEKQRHAAELNKQQNEVESLKELLYTYEKTMEHKDHIIGNMTKAIHKQKERFDLMRRFSVWKLKHVEEKKEGFGLNLARKHYSHVLKRKLMSAWRAVVETKWKQKVEKACQSKAQDVCIKLTDEYEAQLQETNKALEEARLEVGRLHAEREIYEETMKKAFMRGVCALNLEAMHMFREPGDENERPKGGEPCGSRDDRSSTDSGNEMVPRSNPPKPSTVATDRRHGNPPQIPAQTKPGNVVTFAPATTVGHTTRTINVKAVARPEFRPSAKSSNLGVGLPGAASISSVLVQRHSGNDAIQSKTVRKPQPSSQATGAKLPAGAKIKPGPIRTSHAPPMKVVH